MKLCTMMIYDDVEVDAWDDDGCGKVDEVLQWEPAPVRGHTVPECSTGY